MSVPSVYVAINAISAELAKSGISKGRTNEVDKYKYRSIDDVLAALAPLLASHRLRVLPRVLKREVIERADADGQSLISVALRVAYILTSAEDGSAHEVQVFGEAQDGSDKATAKALSGAYKSAMVQTFCIPVLEMDDQDRTSPKPSHRSHEREPVQGWTQWCLDIEDIVSLCESEQALSTVQERNRQLLNGLSREQPQLYKTLGASFASRRQTLAGRRSRSSAEVPTPTRRRRSKTELQDA